MTKYGNRNSKRAFGASPLDSEPAAKAKLHPSRIVRAIESAAQPPLPAVSSDVPDGISQHMIELADGLIGVQENQLEAAIGHQVRQLRQQLDLTVVDLGKIAGISPGMLSKIENGSTSPSLGTLKALSIALNVPVTGLFRKYEEQREASYVPAGSGFVVKRRGSRHGHQYQLLGHLRRKSLQVEPYLISLTEASESFPLFQHPGTEFLYMLEGEVDYRHGEKLYSLRPGDSLMFDSDAPHGPEILRQLPARYISIVFYTSNGEQP